MSNAGSRTNLFDTFTWAQRSGLVLDPNIETIIKFGHNGAIGLAQEDIMTQGGTLVYLSTAERMNIASTNAADTATTSTGAWTVTINGLDNDYNEQIETVNLNGTNNVLTSAAFLRVFRMRILTAGSTGHNVGSINATAQTAEAVQCQCPALENQSLHCLYTVPAGKTFLITDLHFGSPSNDDCEIRLKIRSQGGVFQTKYIMHLNETSVVASSKVVYNIPEKSDIKITGLRLGGGDVDISTAFMGVLMSNTLFS